MNEIIFLFTKLGSIGFGGPIALIGMMEEECVRQRAWLTIEEFQKFVAVSKLFPGPLATLVAIRIGIKRQGRIGGLAAGLSLILPAFFMILILAQVMKGLGQFTWVQPFITGLTLSALAISMNAAVSLSKPLFVPKKDTPPLPKKLTFAIMIILAACTFYFPRQEALFIIFTGIAGFLLYQWKPTLFSTSQANEGASVILFLLLFYTCFKASLLTFGSGIAIVPALRAVFIDQNHWISNEDFLKGLTLGQITPGPLVIVSTYLGYVIAKTPGAIISTLGIFLPTFILGIFVMPTAEKKIQGSVKLRSFFQWLLPAVCGAIFGAMMRLLLFSVYLNEQWLWGRLILIVFLTALALRFKIHSLKMLGIGGVLAYFISS